jgi:pyruvate/2-oxoglutarate dehydrogenase complex dihydrolipoamide dehydrogenase (E3) component
MSRHGRGSQGSATRGERSAKGFITDEESVGELASELIHIGQFVIQAGGTIDRFIDATFAVPTRSEAYKYAAYDG